MESLLISLRTDNVLMSTTVLWSQLWFLEYSHIDSSLQWPRCGLYDTNLYFSVINIWV